MMVSDVLLTPRSRGSRRRARFAGYLALTVLDAMAILFGFFLASIFRQEQFLNPAGVNLGLATLVMYLGVSLSRNGYSMEVLGSITESLLKSLTSLALAAMVIVFLSFATQSGLLISRFGFMIAVAIGAFTMALGRILCDQFYLVKLDGKMTDVLFIVDGTDWPGDTDGHSILDTAVAGLRPDLNDPEMLNRIAQLVRDYDRVIICCPMDARRDWSVVLKGTQVSGEFLLGETNRLGAIGVGEIGGRDTMIVARGPLSFTSRMKKRVFDLAIALPLLIAIAPLLIVVAIAIKIDTPGPVIFRQKRMGQSNAIFDIFKFRTMKTENTDASGVQSTLPDDDRITRVGKFLRATSIDELPQLANVVIGNMSIVGPRPHALGSQAGDQFFWEISSLYWTRHALKPGITGLAQIRGFRGATHRREDLEGRLHADLEYLNGWRLMRDVAILFGTVRVLVHKNAY